MHLIHIWRYQRTGEAKVVKETPYAYKLRNRGIMKCMICGRERPFLYLPGYWQEKEKVK